jgi:hypothetical protein
MVGCLSKYTREKIKLPKSIKPKDRVQIAEVIINHIISRSAAGLDRNNKKFPKYSKDYADSKGVGVNDVDLILSGEMLEELELVNHTSGSITIGYRDPSDELAGKVEGNRIGSYGGEPNKKKARDFLGIDADELEILISSYENEIDLGSSATDAGFSVGDILDDLLRDEL